MMDYIEQISNQYGGEILLHDPYTGEKHKKFLKRYIQFYKSVMVFQKLCVYPTLTKK